MSKRSRARTGHNPTDDRRRRQERTAHARKSKRPKSWDERFVGEMNAVGGFGPMTAARARMLCKTAGAHQVRIRESKGQLDLILFNDRGRPVSRAVAAKAGKLMREFIEASDAMRGL